MSAEAGLLTLIGKFLWAPFLLVFGFFAKRYFGDLEGKLKAEEKKSTNLEAKIVALEKELIVNYYDKRELKEQIVEPIMQRILEQDAQLKAIAGMMNDVHQDMAILKYKILGEELHNQKR